MVTDAPAKSPVPDDSPSAPTQKQEASSGRLVVIKPDGTEGASIPLSGGTVELGRESEYEALSSDPFLSPVHARLERQNDGFVVSDAGSLNGVFLRISSEVELSDGDHIRIGQELLEFREMDGFDAENKAPDDKTLSGGSPDNGNWGRLGLIAGPDLETRAFVFAADEVTLGREIGDIVFRDDGFVSGKHARIAKVEGRVYLKDLGSSNGTYVRIRKPRAIQDGDLILMGQQLFRLEM
jgi:pSer/pThr/pTyr-binding forkhead associated (FHA) protein